MKVVSAGVGAVLLTASLTLAYLANNNAEKMIANQDAIVMKYINDSTTALENEDIKGAIKFAKLAIAFDPKSKKAFKAYENAVELKYKPNEEVEDTSSNQQPSAVEEEEEEGDMGC